MNKTSKQIKQEIEREFIGGRYDGINATEEILSNIVGQAVKHYDTCIDDGADGEECRAGRCGVLPVLHLLRHRRGRRAGRRIPRVRRRG